MVFSDKISKNGLIKMINKLPKNEKMLLKKLLKKKKFEKKDIINMKNILNVINQSGGDNSINILNQNLKVTHYFIKYIKQNLINNKIDYSLLCRELVIKNGINDEDIINYLIKYNLFDKTDDIKDDENTKDVKDNENTKDIKDKENTKDTKDIKDNPANYYILEYIILKIYDLNITEKSLDDKIESKLKSKNITEMNELYYRQSAGSRNEYAIYDLSSAFDFLRIIYNDMTQDEKDSIINNIYIQKAGTSTNYIIQKYNTKGVSQDDVENYEKVKSQYEKIINFRHLNEYSKMIRQTKSQQHLYSGSEDISEPEFFELAQNIMINVNYDLTLDNNTKNYSKRNEINIKTAIDKLLVIMRDLDNYYESDIGKKTEQLNFKNPYEGLYSRKNFNRLYDDLYRIIINVDVEIPIDVIAHIRAYFYKNIIGLSHRNHDRKSYNLYKNFAKQIKQIYENF
jgi:hypothetical protein